MCLLEEEIQLHEQGSEQLSGLGCSQADGRPARLAGAAGQAWAQCQAIYLLWEGLGGGSCTGGSCIPRIRLVSTDSCPQISPGDFGWDKAALKLEGLQSLSGHFLTDEF